MGKRTETKNRCKKQRIEPEHMSLLIHVLFLHGQKLLV